ncbi:hypothetical protein TVAG_038490 [Trichomonas vaginalis G3]|uniref:RING-type domain-containing protein n=1 Tax=Trichomonas vaginalis (strain ATCC PRA-98 / G3) TaxID=412133 RepID=A2DY05_TRIV3|nr:ubiquitin-like protein transferase protein [Trichomonas vaginalis G3]EAY14741.1 hypothetical protein TVAG_038490 [Trichomonas vaginalis G3]KAI5487888.1 ubiquitin-like protein transferase protein [Trichomonas vaginalis G3]|eukprot:XP_001326964.1 hypothetical protein [Trichomonas vaginalis G3]
MSFFKSVSRQSSIQSEYAFGCPEDSYKFISNTRKFAPQPCRAHCHRRPSSINPYTAGNFQFVYKNPAQLDKHSESTRKIDELNDALFGHCFWPESGIQWDLLYAAIAHVSDEYVCPICLFTPVAPRLTICGHIICADCLQLLMNHSDKVMKCPVCGEIIGSHDFIRCKCIFDSKLTKCTFSKVYRYVSDNICFGAHGQLDSLRVASDPLNKFTRFTIADSKFIESMQRGEIEALQTQHVIYAEEPEKVAAIQSIIESIQKETVDDDKTVFRTCKHTDSEQKVTFYQSVDGRIIFMNQLNKKMLIEQFGSLDKAPDSIEAPVMSTSIGYEYDTDNSHIPSGAECVYAFLDFTNIVSKDVLAQHSREIKKLTPVVVKKHVPTRVITKDDFQKFIPEEHHPEPTLSDEQEFPSLSPSKPALPKKEKPKQEEDFPSFDSLSSQPQPKRGKKKTAVVISAWGNINF